MMDCVFCKIVEGSIPSKKVFETDTVLAFRDVNPVAPEHILIIPKKHIPTMNDVVEEDLPLIGEIMQAAQRIAEMLGIKERGYRLVNNCNEEGGQSVYHLHFHLLGGKKLSHNLGG